MLATELPCPRGEIDIIAEKGDEVAFVEVKSWAALPRGGAGALDRPPQAGDGSRARRATISRRQPRSRRMRLRFDVVFLGGESRGIQHIENAFNGGID